MTETQIKLIEASEIEFAVHGYEGASVRSITKRAGANIASVNYHFGSKEALFIEMIRHRIAPINETRLRLLDETDKRREELQLRELVEIIIRPLIGGLADKPHFIRAMGRGLSEENRFMSVLYEDILSEVIRRFRAALAEILHPLPDAEIDYCYHFLACTLSGSMLQHRRLEKLQEPVDLEDPASCSSDRLIDFIVGGIEAVRDGFEVRQKM